jgi:hypothetical protein
MKHFANIDANNLVVTVVAIEEDSEYINEYISPEWIETNPGMFGGVLYDFINGVRVISSDQSKCLRKNYAGIGFTYDTIKDAFIPPKLFESWTFDEIKCMWIPPVEYPNDTENNYLWNETTLSWDVDPRDLIN